MNGCFRYLTSLESATHYAARVAGSGLFIDENEGLRPSLRLYRPYGLHIPQAEPAEFNTSKIQHPPYSPSATELNRINYKSAFL